jgi:hypothetical protein
MHDLFCSFANAAEPSLVLSPDCKHLAVKEPCSRRICLLSAQDGFKEVLTTLEPLPVEKDGDIVADTVLSCSWSTDSKLLLVACKSSAVYLFDKWVARRSVPLCLFMEHLRSKLHTSPMHSSRHTKLAMPHGSALHTCVAQSHGMRANKQQHNYVLLGTRQQRPAPLSARTRPFSCSTGRLLCHWDPTWPWAQVQLVAACHGPGNTILILTAARVVFLVAHSGDKQQRGSAAGVESGSSSEGGDPQLAQPFAQQQVLKSYSVKVGGELQKVALPCCAVLCAAVRQAGLAD